MKGIVAQFILALRHRLESVGCYVGVGPFSSVVLISLHVVLFGRWDGILWLTRSFFVFLLCARRRGLFLVYEAPLTTTYFDGFHRKTWNASPRVGESRACSLSADGLFPRTNIAELRADRILVNPTSCLCDVAGRLPSFSIRP